MYLLFPGRHHLLTTFQYKYVSNILISQLKGLKDVNGGELEMVEKIEGVVFAVTSANHSGTKRNPIPFYLRAMMIQEFSKDLNLPVYVYGIDDVGILENFAEYTLKQIKHQSDQQLILTPENTAVICSTPVLDMYLKLGFTVLPAELEDYSKQSYSHKLPWDLIEELSNSETELQSDVIHTSSRKIWLTYSLADKVKTILLDPIIGEDGDITESRDYNTYVRQMDEIAEIKFKDTSPFIVAGRIGDIGCAVGSWIKQASEEQALRESDFYGIEVARQLFDICTQRKHNGEFKNPNVFFAQKNAVTSLVFEKESMNTIHTSSLTHEIESYGSREDLLKFIKNRYEELAPGGVWINRDVVGPVDGDQEVLMLLNKEDGINDDFDKEFSNHTELTEYLNQLSTYSRFLRFAKDFRKQENDQIQYSVINAKGKKYIKLRYMDAADFMLTKDYTDNWMSEMHERFCFWSINDWKEALEDVGFTIGKETHAYTNQWIVDNRFDNKVQLFNSSFEKVDNPPTNVLIVARKIS
ncbi:class I SAM-dependent methyltransferase [Marinigracilibium pacificum]|uniref:Transferase n=1 Tax=Marinigracilibium pacificum TaxID=2729599 RepID=A0A848J295_9BACT|nr:transferase [Marinigracilibium pacificum]NMM49906.1 transferase [Marinigracilibium pacificum]